MSLDFIAGCLGGMAGVVVGHPLDTVKVHLQTQDSKNPKYKGTIDCIRKLASSQGFKGVYRGVTSPLLGVAGINAIVFGIYGNSQRYLGDADSLKSHALAGAAAGLCQSVICSPMELVKSRLQVAENGSQSLWECCKKIYTTEGIRGVFRGYGITVAREIPAFSAYFFTYELLTRSESNEPVSTWNMLLSGGLAGVVSWAIVYPVDMIKSRMQIDGITSTRYKNSYDCLKKSVQSGGVSCLFRGLTPTLIRAFPVNAVTFTVVTWTMRIFNGDGLPETVKKTESILERYTDVVCTLGSTENSVL